MGSHASLFVLSGCRNALPGSERIGEGAVASRALLQRENSAPAICVDDWDVEPAKTFALLRP
jgi:hypothetical protein